MFKAIGGFGGFSVKDLEAAREFYVDTLELDVEEDEMGLTVNLPENGKVFVYPKENHEPATFTVLNLIVEDIDSAVEALAEKGVTFEQYHMAEFSTDEKGIARGLTEGKGPDIAWFKDPSENIFSLIQES